MAENKTKPTRASVADYIASRANTQQRADCRELMAMFKKITGASPRMWGPTMVGYGSFGYTYESGRTGTSPKAAFAIRGRDLVVYVFPEAPKQKALLAKLGKHTMGKSCLYFRQLADLDKSVLEKLVIGSIAEAKRRHG
jgi:nucleoid DNA-binding protein